MSQLPPYPTPDEAVRASGPWEHRFVSANGARFHTVTMGDGPAVLLVHGFPTYWYTWRHLLPALAEAGYRAIAMDLRGYGGTDHTPRGYDPFTLSGDLSGVIRSLGHRQATVIGHGWGGFVAWSAAVLEPDLMCGLVPVSMPHPVVLRRAILSDPNQRQRSRYAMGFQLPRRPEKRLVRDDAQAIGDYLHEWSANPAWPTADDEVYFRRAFQYRATAHCALEYHRWAIRSIARPDGIRYIHRMEHPITTSVLQIHGASDETVLPSSVDGSEEFVAGDYQRVDLPGVGHFPHDEDPAGFAATLLPWLTRVQQPSTVRP